MATPAKNKTASKPSAGAPVEAVDDQGAGNASYKGYAYQKRVTAWIALTLLLERSDGPAQIIVEPISSEDVEATIDDASTTVLVPDEVKLTVQIKFRGAGHWSVDAFARLVTDKEKRGVRGPQPRARACSLLLADPQRRYVLVTNTSVDAGLSDGRISKIDETPASTFLPAKLKRSSSEQDRLRGRWGLVEGLSWGELDARIQTLLEGAGKVPAGNVKEVLARLERAIDDRLLGLAAPFTRAQVASVVEAGGGLPPYGKELAEFVAPAAFERAKALLAKHHAVLLMGLPGLGKSLIAKQLVYSHRTQAPPFEVRRETEGLAAIDALLDARGRHIVYLDDPWGQSKLDSEASEWTSRLPALLRRATSDKVFVITSRTDILALAHVSAEQTPWRPVACSVTLEDYGPNGLWAIATRKLQGAPTWQCDFALQHRERLLASLNSPLAIDRFVKLLMACGDPAEAKLLGLINDAQTESIAHTVRQQVEGWTQDGVACATVVWAMARRSRSMDPERMGHIRRGIQAAPGFADTDLDRFIKHFRAGALSSEGGTRLSAHGKVIEALEAVIKKHPAKMERTLEATATALLDLHASDPTYLDELYRIVDAARDVAAEDIRLSWSVTDAVDKLLIQSLNTDDERAFTEALRALVLRASRRSGLVKLAVALQRGEAEARSLRSIGWRAPALSDAQREALKAASGAEHLVQMWVKCVLPFASEIYDAKILLPWLTRFGFDLSAAWLDACKAVAETPRYLTNADTVFEAATMDGPAERDAELFGLLEELERKVNSREDLSPRRPWQGELDYAEQLHVQDQLEEEGGVVSNAIDGYARGRRQREGHGWFQTHTRQDLLLPAWVQAMRRDDPGASELRAYLSIAPTPAARASALQVIGESKIVTARPLLVEALHSGSGEERISAVRALALLAADEDVVLSELAAALGATDLVGFAELLLAARERERREAGTVLRRLRVLVPESRHDLLDYVTLLSEKNEEAVGAAFSRLPPGDVDRLIAAGPRSLGRCLLAHSAQDGIDVSMQAKAYLVSTNCDDVRAALVALAEGPKPSRDLLAGALRHEHYEVRRDAMQLLGAGATADERLQILALAKDPSAPVRESVVELIGKHAWRDALPILLDLLSDKRDYNAHPETDEFHDPRYNVARAAANVLAAFSPLPADALAALEAFVRSKKAASADVELHARLIGVIGQHDEERSIKILCSSLADRRALGSEGEMVYPVRYAAAWALYHLVADGTSHWDAIDWSAVERAAQHADSQLAGPCLCLLGLTLSTPRPETLAVLRDARTSDVRRILALANIDHIQRAQDLARKFDLLSVDHPFMTAGEGADTASGWASATWQAWLHSLDRQDHVSLIMLKVAASLARVDLGVEDLDVTKLRRKERVPITTFSELFGME